MMDDHDKKQIFENMFRDIGVECERCGHRWLRRTDRPRKCPKCQSAAWDKPRADK